MTRRFSLHHLALMRFAAIAALVTLPLMAIAAPGSLVPVVSSGPGLLDQVLGMVFSPAGLGTILALAGTVAGLFHLSDRRKKQIALAVYHAFHIVEDLKAELPENATLNKVDAGLKAANDYLLANGWRAMKPGEELLAQLGFKSLHGEDKVDERKAITASVAAALASPPSP